MYRFERDSCRIPSARYGQLNNKPLSLDRLFLIADFSVSHMGFFRCTPFLPLLAASIGITSAQVSNEFKYETALSRAFDAGADLEPCAVTPIRPELDFSLRFQTGFTMDLSPGQLTGPHHYGVIVLRVTPESGRPAYLLSRINLPDMTNAKIDGHVRGGFVVGEGKYKVEMIFGNDLHQLCRSQWGIEAKPDRSQRNLRIALPPLTAAGF